MKLVGSRHIAEPTDAPDAAARRAGLHVNDSFASFGWAASTGQAKGVYRFKTFEAMEAHRLQCLARAMAELASTRR
jgi:hypothetical protein